MNSDRTRRDTPLPRLRPSTQIPTISVSLVSIRCEMQFAFRSRRRNDDCDYLRGKQSNNNRATERVRERDRIKENRCCVRFSKTAFVELGSESRALSKVNDKFRTDRSDSSSNDGHRSSSHRRFRAYTRLPSPRWIRARVYIWWRSRT